MIDLGDGIVPRDRLTALGGFQMLDLRPTLAETGSYLFQKRIFDITFSILILFITLPITLLIALVIKLASRGPVFFVQDRVGLNGRVFRDVQIPHYAGGQPGRRRHALDLQP